ncbi:MAG: cytochrome c oxidase subunit 3 [Pseudomonadota bacterium]|jgi:cytochrome c oxidase subunit 3
MGLFLLDKPWLASAKSDAYDGAGALRVATPMFGLRVFLVVITILFSLFASAYLMRMELADWRPLPEPWLLWPNTVLLLLSSGALHWAWHAARREKIEAVRSGLLVSGAFAIAFLAGQILAWRQLGALGYFAAANPANAFFYLLTGLHGLHLTGGLVAWGRTVVKLQRGVAPARLRASIALCAVYWHFLLLVWLALFALLLIT